MRHTRLALTAAVVALGVPLFAAPVTAHAGALSGSLRSVPVPSWLVVITGGGIIGASFLFTSLLTDHALIRSINAASVRARTPSGAWAAVRSVARVVGVAGLVVIVVVGLTGPGQASVNLAVLVVWVGWWAGYTMSVYLVGNTWPALNPWRTLADRLPEVDRRDLPGWADPWLGVGGLLALVWIEVVSPVASDPRSLAAVVAGYTVVTLAGALRYGPGPWFDRVDPIARVFRCYGSLAPIQRRDDGLELSIPTAALAHRDRDADSDVPFVVALLWVTTYDGIVSTPAWADLARGVVRIGVPPLALYLAVALAGFGVFLWAYRWAARAARRTADTYVTAGAIGRWFAPSLLPIAAGYHLAHFLGYFLSLVPALAVVVSQPLSPPTSVPVLTHPGWFGGLQLVFVVVGHLFAVWIAHALSFDLFPGRLQPVRSQYPFIVVMIAYTVTSLWIVSQPFAAPPFV